MKQIDDYIFDKLPSAKDGAYSFVIKQPRETYDEFLKKFTSMSEDELQTWDVLYSTKHYTIMSFLSVLFRNKEFNTAPDYCLVDTRNMSSKRLYEGDIITLPAKQVIHMLVKKFVELHPDNPVSAPEWLKPIYNAGQRSVEELTKFFPLSPKQIGIESGIDLETTEKIFIAIPDIADNKPIIRNAMRFFGYFLLSDEPNEYRSEVNGTPWTILTFSPNFQEYVNKYILKENKYLYHVSPTKFEHKILKQGLVPSTKNEKFSYPHRIYLILGHRETLGSGEYDFGEDDALDVARMLAKAKLIRHDKYVDDNLYTLYRIDVSKLSENVRFSYDMEYKPLGIFTAENISPNALEVVDRFDIRKPKRIVEL